MTPQEQAYGFPLVCANNVYEVLQESGIVPWKTVEGPIPLPEYAERNLSAAERRDLGQFAPKSQAVIFCKPNNGQRYVAFRATGRNWQTTFTLLPNPHGTDDLVLLVCEWKQGIEAVSISPPSGVPTPDDCASDDPFAACAVRTLRQEVGIELERVIPLSQQLVGVSTRQLTQGYYPFLGIPKLPIVRKISKLESRGLLKAVVMPVSEWLMLIRNGQAYEECAVGVTLRALLYLNRLPIHA
ncbi:MAG: hypothetical protein WCV85_00305 [Patescibacteria group bacterium]